jgi:hypothetical protein
MKKLAGLLAFAVALACAVLLTQYYSPSQKQVETPPTPPAPAAATPAATGAGVSVPVVFKPRLVTLDVAAKKASVALSLERDPARPAPESVWVWAYFFTQEAPGRFCEGDPVEIKKPFDAGARTRATASVTVEIPVAGCPEPRAPSTTFYARFNVSSESAFAARLGRQRISYDITQASPVILQGARK